MKEVITNDDKIPVSAVQIMVNDSTATLSELNSDNPSDVPEWVLTECCRALFGSLSFVSVFG